MPFKLPPESNTPTEIKVEPTDAGASPPVAEAVSHEATPEGPSDPQIVEAVEAAQSVAVAPVIVEMASPGPAPEPPHLVHDELVQPAPIPRLGRMRGRVVVAARRAKLFGKPAAAAAALAATLGLGYAMGTNRSPADGSQAQIMTRLSGDLAAMKSGLEALKGERAATRADAKLVDKLERTSQDSAAKIGKLAEQIERLEKAQRDPSRSQAVLERIDRLEKGLQVASAGTPAPAHAAASPGPAAAPVPAPQVASAPTPPPKPAAIVAEPSQTGSIAETRSAKAEPKAEAEARPDPRRTALEGYVLRDVDDGYALIETRSGKFHEVAVGQVLPGIGKVEAVERRGRQWVVVTARGFIGERWN